MKNAHNAIDSLLKQVEINKLYTNPDYTGASAQKYIDKYTNRPEDAGSMEGIQGLLGKIGMIPGVGEPADWLNAGIYASKGDYSNAALYGSGLGMLGGLKLFRGIPEWFRGSVKGRKWLGGDVGGKPGIFATPEKKYADDFLVEDWDYPSKGGRLMEFDIPDEYVKKLYKSDIDEASGFIEGGIPKEFLKKVHKPRYSEWDKKWFYNKLDDVIDELK